MQAKSQSRLFLNFLAGSSLGITVGFLAGMAVSPVVGALLGTLGTAGVAFLTLGRHGTGLSNLVRVTGFGFACLFGVLSGVYIRSNNIVGLTPKRFVLQLQEAGFSREQALAQYSQRFGVAETNEVTQKITQHTVGGLFSGESEKKAALQEMLRKNSDWSKIVSNVRISHAEWLNTTLSIDQTAAAPEEKRKLLIALACQP